MEITLNNLKKKYGERTRNTANAPYSTSIPTPSIPVKSWDWWATTERGKPPSSVSSSIF